MSDSIPTVSRFLFVLPAILAVTATGRGGETAPLPGERKITAEDRSHWAFRPPGHGQPPDLAPSDWVRNPIDAFILKALEEGGLRPSPEADRATLLRRLSYDLTGLPPSLEEQDEFLGDRSADAYERLVDRLLASPRYGERWAQHWLDLARYADTDGYEFDQTRPDAWRYRDWVVAALNGDMPYDRFVALQLAGDELAPDDPDAFIATGFNRCYPDMVDLNDQALRRQNALNDVTETTGLVFLGLTIGCARCHDHKFDPIRIGDFYRLQAYFTPARFRDDIPLAPARERAEHERRVKQRELKLAKARRMLLRLEKPVRDRLAPGLPPGVPDDVVAAFRKEDRDWTPAEAKALFEAFRRDPRLDARKIEAALNPAVRALRQGWLAYLASVERNGMLPLPQARGLDEAAREAPPTYLLKRGDFANKGPQLAPGVPDVLLGPGEAPPAPVPGRSSTGRRRALAAWLTHPDHPLTARVIVNRLWQHHFGRGIVATTSDFGVIGAAPSHPELLDWLARELIARGWSLKAMHRLIVTSASYRQSSRANASALAADPDNDLCWRNLRKRLDGEAIRDALLAVSGRLNPVMGGPGIFPDLPPELAGLNSRGSLWPVSPRPEDRRRRSLYVFVRRNLRFPFFEAYDRPDTNASCPNRPVTTIAPQALSLLNSPFAQESARAFARRLGGEHDRDRRIVLAYRIALGRTPDAEESAAARDFLGGGEERWPLFCLALLNANEFVYID